MAPPAQACGNCKHAESLEDYLICFAEPPKPVATGKSGGRIIYVPVRVYGQRPACNLYKRR